MLSLSLVNLAKGKRSHRHSERRHLKNVFSVNHTGFLLWSRQRVYRTMVANVNWAQIHRHETHKCEATTAKADRHQPTHNNLIPLQADNIVYASQTLKDNIAGEEIETMKSILAETHTHTLLYTDTPHTHITSEMALCTYRYTHSISSRQCSATHKTEANNSKHSTWYLKSLYYSFQLQSPMRITTDVQQVMCTNLLNWL